MVCKGERFIIRTEEDASSYVCPNKHTDRPDEAGSYPNMTILGDEPAQPGGCDADDSVNFHYVHITTLPVGACVGQHYHHTNEQFYLVLKGKAEITLCDNKFQVEPYTIAVIRPGGKHGIRNIGDEDLVYVACEIEPARKYPYELEESFAKEAQ